MHLTLQDHFLITHAGCMDGSAAAIMFMAAGGLRKNIRYVSPDKVDDAIAESSVFKNPNKQVLFVDVCPHSDDALFFLEQRGDFTVIDHHASAKKFAGRPGFLIDIENKACGSENFRRWLERGGMTKFGSYPWFRFAQIVDDHDRWILNEPMSIQMPMLFAFTGQQEFVDRFSNVEERFKHASDLYWDPIELELIKLVRNAQDRRFRRIMDKFQTQMVNFKGKEYIIGYVISGEVNNSELLHKYLEQHPEADAACQINFDLDKVSLRSSGRLNITEFAMERGGGGHSNSGGHPLPDGMVKKIFEALHA
jgi:oligoribonuclease NrnB/cAMP/cGMP phosphodiesterase (DHH superfamily)